MIELREISKLYGRTVAVDRLTFTVQPGRVTGFLGPNGAGKSTTLRVILGLDAPTSGTATIDGRAYQALSRPLCRVGALLDSGAVPGARTARDHLRWLARSNGLPGTRAETVLGMVGLGDVAHRRVGGFSLGMKQRLGIAAALLGDPPALILDEPINGLDPEGIRWLRGLLRDLASQGRCVLVSSHLMSEMQATADHLVVIGQGRLVADTDTQTFIERAATGHVTVRSPHSGALASLLIDHGGHVIPGNDDVLHVHGITADAIGDLAYRRGIAVHEITPHMASLEEAFMRLTADTTSYTAKDARP
jgi:ABC-2 type transport system ATP-binding protein